MTTKLEEMTGNEIVAEWQAAKNILQQAQRDETAIRVIALKTCFDYTRDLCPDFTGTKNYELPDGYKFKATFSIERKLTKDKEKLEKALNAIEKLENGKLLVERLIKYEPKLVKAEYDQLPDAHRAIIDTVIESSQASPSVELAVPKGSRL